MLITFEQFKTAMRAIKKKLDFITMMIPKKTSDLENDSGFLTVQDDIGGIFIIHLYYDNVTEYYFNETFKEIFSPYSSGKTLILCYEDIYYFPYEIYYENNFIQMTFLSLNDGFVINMYSNSNYSIYHFPKILYINNNFSFYNIPTNLSFNVTFRDIVNIGYQYSGPLFMSSNTPGKMRFPIAINIINDQTVRITVISADGINAIYQGTGQSEEYVNLQYIGSNISNWNENDYSKASYIENRTHWVERQMTSIYSVDLGSNSSIVPKRGLRNVLIEYDSNQQLVAGQYYNVKIGNTTYNNRLSYIDNGKVRISYSTQWDLTQIDNNHMLLNYYSNVTEANYLIQITKDTSTTILSKQIVCPFIMSQNLQNPIIIEFGKYFIDLGLTSAVVECTGNESYPIIFGDITFQQYPFWIELRNNEICWNEGFFRKLEISKITNEVYHKLDSNYLDFSEFPSDQVLKVTITNTGSSFTSDHTYSEIVQFIENGGTVYLENQFLSGDYFEVYNLSNGEEYNNENILSFSRYDPYWGQGGNSFTGLTRKWFQVSLDNEDTVWTYGSNDLYIPSDITYELSISNNVITLTDSGGGTSTVTLPVYNGGVST